MCTAFQKFDLRKGSLQLLCQMTADWGRMWWIKVGGEENSTKYGFTRDRFQKWNLFSRKLLSRFKWAVKNLKMYISSHPILHFVRVRFTYPQILPGKGKSGRVHTASVMDGVSSFPGKVSEQHWRELGHNVGALETNRWQRRPGDIRWGEDQPLQVELGNLVSCTQRLEIKACAPVAYVHTHIHTHTLKKEFKI